MNYSTRKNFENKVVNNNSLILLMVYIYHRLISFLNDNLKHTAISQRISFSFLSFNFLFLLCFSFLLFLFKLSYAKKQHVYNLYFILHTLTFCYVIYYIVLEIYIGGRFLEDCFYCYLILSTPNVAPNQIKQM